jgi:drug/metabolite transporter (DMT)-like permease
VSRYDVAVAFAVMTLLQGLSFPAFEVGLTSFPVLMLAALRYDVSVVVLFGYVVSTRTTWRPTTAGDWIAIVAGGIVTFTISTALWSVGQKMTTSAFSGLMASLVPVVTAGFAWLLLPEDRLSTVGVVGLFVALSGAVVMMLPDQSLAFESGVVGKALVFLGVVTTGLGGVLIRWSRPRLPASSLTAWSFLIGAVCLHVLSGVTGETVADVRLTVAGVFAVFFLGVVTSAIGRGVYFWLLARRSAIEISLTAYVSPLIAGLAGYLLFEDRITVPMVAGFGVVVVGFALIKRRELRAEYERLSVSM